MAHEFVTRTVVKVDAGASPMVKFEDPAQDWSTVVRVDDGINHMLQLQFDGDRELERWAAELLMACERRRASRMEGAGRADAM